MTGLQSSIDQNVDNSIANKDDQHPLVQQLETLQQQGVNQYDPVRFCFIASLAHRALAQRATVRERLVQKAQRALDEYNVLLTAEQQRIAPISPHSSVVVALSSLRKVLADTSGESVQGDVAINGAIGSGGGEGLVESISGTTVDFTEQLFQQERTLLRDGEAQGVDLSDSHSRRRSIRSSAPLPTLKAGVAYQKYQHQQRIDHFIDSAFNETPENPGPVNPEILAIKLLRQINDLSPAYISRYVTYFETLQWLEQEALSASKQKK
jgi:hypothetical protein